MAGRFLAIKKRLEINPLTKPHQAGAPVFVTLLHITGAKPKPDAAADAWSRIEKFFGEHLK